MNVAEHGKKQSTNEYMPEDYISYIGIRLNKYNEFVSYMIMFRCPTGEVRGFRAYSKRSIIENCTLGALGFKDIPGSWTNVEPIKDSNVLYHGDLK